MDILSHGLWGGATVGRKNKKSFWLAFIFGIAPDFLSFGIFTPMVILGLAASPDSITHHIDPKLVPSFVYGIYDITHSLVVFISSFLLVALFLKKPMWEMCAWGMHIGLDIFTHSEKFFPTPFLWPLSNFHINGISWVEPIIFIPNLTALAAVYGYWYWKKKSKKLP